jgi:hypothetical protein
MPEISPNSTRTGRKGTHIHHLELGSLSLFIRDLFLQHPDLLLHLVLGSPALGSSFLLLQSIKSTLHLSHLSEQIALWVVVDGSGL